MAALDIKLMQIMRHKHNFVKLYPDIPPSVLETFTATILEAFGKYFQKFPEHKVVDLQTFLPRFHTWYAHLSDTDKTIYSTIISKLNVEVDDGTASGIIKDLYEVKLATDMANLAETFNAGELKTELVYSLGDMLDSFKLNSGTKDESEYIDTPIEELLEDSGEDSGLRFRLNAFNKHIRTLQGGDFMIWAGRPDKGKTTMIASEITFMANQLPPDQNVIWFNNEGPGKRLITRIYQSALGVTRSDLWQMAQNGTLRPAYIEAVGRLDRIRVIDIHDKHIGQLESIIEKQNPGIVVYDMLDNVKGFGSEARTDQRLEELYKRGRDLAAKYNHVGMATSQISNEGDGMQFPTLGMLKDSKTGKQGACDLQIMIGASNDPGFAGIRYVSCPKNKLRREGQPGDPRASVAFKPMIARYEDFDAQQALEVAELEAKSQTTPEGIDV